MKMTVQKNFGNAVTKNQIKVIRRKTTKEIFEEFYGKAYEKITAEDIGGGEEIDYGEDVGEEIIR